ncbi:hypothetical protein ACH5RR_026314 [Cinchona calisaya]|uniref:Uncharacterized protein n=1 Tax=Cinchona calisaya TaxID=153742 RepID=A0ABD2Z271_9GENT
MVNPVTSIHGSTLRTSSGCGHGWYMFIFISSSISSTLRHDFETFPSKPNASESIFTLTVFALYSTVTLLHFGYDILCSFFNFCTWQKFSVLSRGIVSPCFSKPGQ